MSEELRTPDQVEDPEELSILDAIRAKIALYLEHKRGMEEARDAVIELSEDAPEDVKLSWPEVGSLSVGINTPRRTFNTDGFFTEGAGVFVQHGTPPENVAALMDEIKKEFLKQGQVREPFRYSISAPRKEKAPNR